MGERRTIHDLSREECIQLLQYQAYVGRIGFVADGHPMVLPVNYIAEETSVTFCTAEGTKLTALAGGAPVAFEVDDHRPLGRAGWSVLVQGTAAEVTDPRDLERLRRGPMKSWAVHDSDHWVRISIDRISGRRIAEG